MFENPGGGHAFFAIFVYFVFQNLHSAMKAIFCGIGFAIWARFSCNSGSTMQYAQKTFFVNMCYVSLTNTSNLQRLRL